MTYKLCGRVVSAKEYINALNEMRNKQQMTEQQVADSFGCTIVELRRTRSAALLEEARNKALELKHNGLSNSEIAKELRVPEAIFNDMVEGGLINI